MNEELLEEYFDQNCKFSHIMPNGEERYRIMLDSHWYVGTRDRLIRIHQTMRTREVIRLEEAAK